MTARTGGFRAVAGALAAVAILAGCGSSSGQGSPEATLQALAAAVNASDDKAVAALICPDERADGQSIAEVKAQAVEADPALKDFRYQATAGPVTEQSGDKAVGTLKIEAKGLPDNLSEAADQFLNQAGGPRPLTLLREDNRITLIRQNGTWFACAD